MKKKKIFIIGFVIGLLIGMGLGVNIGKDQPLWSNPFAGKSLKKTIKKTSGEMIEKSGKVLEESGKALQEGMQKELKR